MNTGGPRFSIVIPSKDEAESLAEVVQELSVVLAGENFEVIVVDDGSTDGSAAILSDLKRCHGFLRHLVHRESCGKSAAILTGVRAATGALIATMDGDGQNDPRFIAPLVALADQPGVGLAAGQRVKHAHSFAKRAGSRFANRLRASLLNDSTRDTACGLKAFRKDMFLQLPYFDNMHRFLPALVRREGCTVRFLDVIDRPRKHGESKYGVIDRALAGLLDLMGTYWLLRRCKRLPETEEVSTDRQ